MVVDGMGEGVEAGEIGAGEIQPKQRQPVARNVYRSSARPTSIHRLLRSLRRLRQGKEMEGAREGAFIKTTCHRR